MADYSFSVLGQRLKVNRIIESVDWIISEFKAGKKFWKAFPGFFKAVIDIPFPALAGNIINVYILLSEENHRIVGTVHKGRELASLSTLERACDKVMTN